MYIQLIVVLIILLAAVFFGYIGNNSINKISMRKYYIIFICFILILQSGLRNIAVGPDTYQYSQMFEQDIVMSWNDIFQNFVDVYQNKIGKDAGYPLLEKVFSVFSTEYRLLLFFIAIVFFISLGHFLYKNTYSIRDALFAFVLYQALFYSFFSITGIRQTLVTAITFWSFEYIKKRKIIPFLILIILAATIHKTVLIFLPLYFIANIKKTKLIYLLSFVLFPITMYIKQYITLWLAVISSVDSYLFYTSESDIAGTPVFTTLIFLIVILGWLFMNKTIIKYPDSFRLFNAIALAFVLTPLTWVDPNLMRVVQYFSVFMLIYLPLILDSIDFKSKFMKPILFGSLILILILLIIKTDSDYKFLWQYMPLGENYD